MLTDGAQTKSGKKGPHTPLKSAAQPLKDKGVEIWSIAIGPPVNISDLEVIASDPEKVISVPSFMDLAHIIEKVQRAACEGTLNVQNSVGKGVSTSALKL